MKIAIVVEHCFFFGCSLVARWITSGQYRAATPGIYTTVGARMFQLFRLLEISRENATDVEYARTELFIFLLDVRTNTTNELNTRCFVVAWLSELVEK